jgi:AcrR family transcriptional regulator
MAIRARSLAACVGCSVGAIYNLVGDLDALILLVGQRTMADLNARLDDVAVGRVGDVDRFVALALAYCDFAAKNRNRWRALFEHQMASGRAVPDWFATDQMRLFLRLEEGLAVRLPALDGDARRIRARTLFSAVHGIVLLGLEEKLVFMPLAALQTELATFVRACLAGMAA